METHQRTVETRFTATDGGYAATVMRMTGAFGAAARGADHLRERYGEFRREIGFSTLGMLGLGVGMGAWIEKAKEANAEFTNARKSVAGVLSATLEFPRGTSEIDRYRRSFKLASQVVEETEDTAGRFDMRLDDVTGAYRTLALAAGQFGLSQRQVNELMVGTAATAKRFGTSGEAAADTIARALRTGTIRGVDEFSLSLGRAVGNMHKLNQAQRFQRIRAALQGSEAVADEMSQGMGAQINRAQMAVTAVFREATGPLFKEIASGIADWSKRIREIRENGRPLVQDFAGKLVEGFKVLKDVSGFIKDHWVVIGATFAGIKAGGLLTSLAGNLGGVAGALGKTALGSPLAGGVGAFAGGLGILGQLAPALGGIVTAAGLAAVALHGVYDEWQGRKKQAAELGGFFDEMGKVAQTQQYLQRHAAGLTPDQVEAGKQYAAAHAAAAAEVLKSKGMFENGRISLEKFNGVMDSMADTVRRDFTAKLGMAGLGDVSSGMLGAAAAEMLSKNLAVAQRAAESVTNDKTIKFAKQVNNFNGGIHITQKFDDPSDNVFIRFYGDLMREVGSRTQALTAEPQGD